MPPVLSLVSRHPPSGAPTLPREWPILHPFSAHLRPFSHPSSLQPPPSSPTYWSSSHCQPLPLEESSSRQLDTRPTIAQQSDRASSRVLLRSHGTVGGGKKTIWWKRWGMTRNGPGETRQKCDRWRSSLNRRFLCFGAPASPRNLFVQSKRSSIVSSVIAETPHFVCGPVAEAERQSRHRRRQPVRTARHPLPRPKASLAAPHHLHLHLHLKPPPLLPRHLDPLSLLLHTILCSSSTHCELPDISLLLPWVPQFADTIVFGCSFSFRSLHHPHRCSRSLSRLRASYNGQAGRP